jgi:PAS domain S-box-containing protein
MTDAAQGTERAPAETLPDDPSPQDRNRTHGERLERRLRFEELVADLSARFVNAPHDQVDSLIEEGLQQLLGFFEVDRCGLLQPSEDGTTFQITHVCLAERVPPVPVWENLPTALFPWTYQKLVVRHEVVFASTLEDMPDEASVDKQTYREWGIQSYLHIPIVVTGSRDYIIAINAVGKVRVWPEEYIPRLRLLGEIFVNALERRRSRLELDERLRFEGLISELSGSFVNAPIGGVEADIGRWLRPIAEFFSADRCNIGVFSEGQTLTTRAFEYCREGVESGVGSLSRDEVPWYMEQLIQGQPVVLNRVEDLPAEAERERRFCLTKGLKSVLSIPMVGRGGILGFCTLVSIRGERVWPPSLVQRLRLVGEVFANALAHKHSDDSLRQAALDHRTVLDFTYDWEYWANPDGSLRYVSPSCERITGYTALEFMAEPSLLRKVLAEEDRKHWDDHLVAAQRAHREVQIQFRIRRRDDVVRWIDHICRPVWGENGTFLGQRVSNRDITEHKRLEEQLQARLHEIEELKRNLERENVMLREEVGLHFEHSEIVGQSAAMREVLAQVEQVARTDSTVLILGETGTGKEPLARQIHLLSSRKDRPIVAVSCASLPPSLIESELFGRDKGAYTGALTSMVGRFESADKATLFLDEIGELPHELQTKLLRVLEEGQFERLGSSKPRHVDVRIIAATNRDLAKEVQAGRFRSDLYYRLNVFPITIPPLRERPEDIPQLVWSFVRQFENKMGKRVDSIPKRSMEALQGYAWPGNVRELRNVIERAMIVSGSRALDVRLPALSQVESSSSEASQSTSLADIERKHILGVLQKTGWRITGKGGAAELLGLKRTTLQSRMGKLGIKRPSS